MPRPARSFVLVVLSCAASLTFAAGAGGVMFGLQRPDFAPSFLPSEGAEMGIEHSGGYGYGVDRHGFIVGGFGMGFLDQGLLGDPSPSAVNLAGGIGGMIIGQRVLNGGRVDLDVALRLGLGGIGEKSEKWRGWALAYAEPYAELLVAITPWMALSAQAGYRFMGNFAPGLAFQKVFLRSPVLTFCVSWGSFH
ncbi:MAG: hypothetical protein WCL50_18820 [Spirochaetota bacterium]